MTVKRRKANDDMPSKSAAAAAANASAPSTPTPQQQKKQQQRKQQQQPLFAPYRAIGVVTSPAVAPVYQRRGDTSFVTTSAGRSWQVYECGRLTLRAIGPLLPRSISSLAVRGDATFASCGDQGIVECHRVHVKGTYSLPANAAAPAANLLVLGDWLLATTTLAVSSDASSSSSGGARLLLRGALVRWRVGSFGAPSAVLDLGGGGGGGGSSGGRSSSGGNSRRTGGGGGGGRSGGGGGGGGHEEEDQCEEDFSRPTALCHPPAYVDKVLVAFAGGGLQLWNVAAGAKLHTFRNHNHHHRKAEAGGGGGARVAPIPIPITALEASPALDVVALGRADGSVTLLDARADAALAVFEQAAGPRGASSIGGNGNGNGGGCPPPSSSAAVPAGLALSPSFSSGSPPPLGCGSITSLAFSTGPGVPLLAAGGEAGGVGLWNLESRSLAGALPRAHFCGGGGGGAGVSNSGLSSSSSSPPSSGGGGVTGLHFFPGEPRLATAGRDNAIKQWALDGDAAAGRGPAPGAREGDLARLLRSREGHAAPPTLLRFYGDGGNRILSAGGPGDRSLRLFSCVRDAASRELSQKGAGNKRGLDSRAAALGVAEEELRLPRVVSMDASQTRERDWANVVTAHEGDPVARTWRVATSAAGHVSLVPPKERVAVAVSGNARAPAATRPRAAAATAVCLSACGNFALVGSARGHVDRYNMQSGRWRQAYRRRVAREGEGGAGGEKKKSSLTFSVLLAHDGAVSGLAADVGCGLGGIPSPPSSSSSSSSAIDARSLSAARARKSGSGSSAGGGRRAVSAGGADGFLRVWNFVSGELEGEVAPSPLSASASSSSPRNSPIHAMAAAARPEGGGGGSSGCALVAAATDDGRLTVVDAERRRVVRRLLPPPGRISDLALSSDGRTLVAACLDGCVAAWDVVAGAALQRVSLLGRGAPVASLALSPDGEMLATAHFCSSRSRSSSSSSSSSGVRLWANQAVFGEGFFEGCGGGTGSGEAASGWRAVRARLPLPPAPSADADNEENEDEEDDDDPAAPGWLSGGGKNLSGDRAWGAGGDGDSSGDEESSEDEEEGGAAEAAASPTAVAVTAAADETLPDGAPAPLGLLAAATTTATTARSKSSSFSATTAIQPLATTSALPRARWAVLPHLDALAARNRPLEPPKKPEAAPFFLPTLPTLDGRPTFEIGTADGDEEENGGGEGAEDRKDGGGNSKRSRVERGFAGNASSAAGGLVAALRAGRKKAAAAAAAASSSSSLDLRASLDAWSLASKWLRTARPHEVDRELRSMLILEPDDDDGDDDDDDDDDEDKDEEHDAAGGEEEENGKHRKKRRAFDEEHASVAAAADAAAADLESLLLFLRARCASGADFELTQAFLAAALALHGASIAARPRLRRAAAALERSVRAAWERLDDSLHAVRCSAAYVGGLPS